MPFNKDPDVEKQKSELDQKMEEILKRKDLTDYEKIKLYQQTLGIYLRLNSSFNPLKIDEDKPKIEEKQKNNQKTNTATESIEEIDIKNLADKLSPAQIYEL